MNLHSNHVLNETIIHQGGNMETKHLIHAVGSPVVEPEVTTDNFNAEDFGGLGESLEDEQDILDDVDVTNGLWDPRNPDDNN